jgi:RHS repeat-associated protein
LLIAMSLLAVSKVSVPPLASWDNEGHLASVTDSAGTSSYIYDAGGNRLIGKDPGGVTAYLPGFELRKVGSTVTATRYYGGVAARTPAGLTWLASDPHGSNQLAINSSTLAVTRRKLDPFGNPRGADPAWPTPRGFVGGTRDTTGLTHLGARDYEPTTGRFISADPIFDATNPQAMGGYSYAGNNPVTGSDPSGLRTEDQYYGTGGSKQLESKQATPGKKSRPGFGHRLWNGFTNGLKRFWVDPVVDLYDEAVNIPKNAHDDGVAIREGRESWGTAAEHAFDHTLRHAFDTLTILGAAYLVIDAGENFAGAVHKFANGDYEGGISDATVGVLEAAAIVAPFKAARAGAAACASFAPDTPVLMADGHTKAIQHVNLGDTVRATDPATGRTTSQPITELHRHLDQELTDLALADAAGNLAILHTTPNHRFWDETQHRWVEASSLDIGDRLHAPDGTPATIAGLLTFAGPKPMYNLTVDTAHTYYVTAGTTTVLVHNEDGSPAVYSDADVDLVEQHLSTLDPLSANDEMIARIRAAMANGQPLTASQQNFMTHELTEASLMSQGASYKDAHDAANLTHPPGQNYDVDIIDKDPSFGPWWRRHNGLPPRC